MTDPTTIRRATRADIPAMAGVVHDWEVTTQWADNPFSQDELASFISEAFDNREIWVHGDPVDAYMSFNPETSQVGALYCRYPGHGTGRAFMNLAKKGREFVWLRTHSPNADAHRFYEREGFVKTTEHPAEPPNTVSEIQMEWRA